jgi:hypothetical protein
MLKKIILRILIFQFNYNINHKRKLALNNFVYKFIYKVHT